MYIPDTTQISVKPQDGQPVDAKTKQEIIDTAKKWIEKLPIALWLTDGSQIIEVGCERLGIEPYHHRSAGMESMIIGVYLSDETRRTIRDVDGKLIIERGEGHATWDWKIWGIPTLSLSEGGIVYHLEFQHQVNRTTVGFKIIT